MDEIRRVYEAWKQNRGSLSAPSVAARVRAFLEAGLVSGVRKDDHRSDPLVALGSSTTYRCRNARGEVKTLSVWGNADGWGIEEV
jgi:hypothetical protein